VNLPKWECDATDARPRVGGHRQKKRLWMQEHKAAELAKWTGVLSSERGVERQQRIDRVVDEHDATTSPTKPRHVTRLEYGVYTYGDVGLQPEGASDSVTLRQKPLKKRRLLPRLGGGFSKVPPLEQPLEEYQRRALNVTTKIRNQMAAVANSHRVLQTSPRSALQSPRSGQAHSPHAPTGSPLRDHQQQHSSPGAAGAAAAQGLQH
jgi:hypothetical protein